MKIRTILELLIVLIVCSCSTQTSKDEQQTVKGTNPHLGSKNGLLIDYGMNQGITKKDTLGTQYRYITATITNDSTIPIHLNLALSKEYDYPATYGEQKYKVFLLPKELTPDTAAIYNNIPVGNFLDRCLDKPYILNKTLKPGEYCVITIGTLFLEKPYQVVPRAVFTQNNKDLYLECDSLINAKMSTNPHLEIGLKVVFCTKCDVYDSCMIIPCGQISYPEH